MGFKLGRARKPIARAGVIDKRLSFRTDNASVPGNEVIRKNLDPGILGEANMDGSIFISKSIQPGSDEEAQVLLHEMRHATDMKTGKLAYGDDFVNGKDMIKVDGQWKEAGDDFPWENDANMV